MPVFAPARSLAASVALTTAAMHIADEGGKDKLLELVASLDGYEIGTASIVLARLLALHCDDDHLQGLGRLAAQGGVVVI